MKNLRRRSFLAGSAGLAAAATTACASSASKDDKTSKGGAASGSPSGTISIYGASGEFGDKLSQLKDFTAKTGIQVKFTEMAFDKYLAAVAAGKAPDIVRMEGGPDAPYLWKNKLAEPLDPYLEKSTILKKDDLDPINNMWRYDGTKQGTGDLLGLVKDYSSDLCVWVNTQVVGEKPSTTEPWTYAKVLDVAKKTTKQSGGRVTNYGYAFYHDFPHFMHLNAMAQENGQELFNSDYSQVDLTKDIAVQGLDWHRQMIESKAMVSFLSKSTTDNFALFKAGRLSMLQSGFWTQGMWGDVKPDMLKNFEMMPAPQMGSTRISPVLSGSGMFISSKAPNKAAAWRFMEYYFGEEPAKDRAKSGWGVPALKSLKSMIPTGTDLQKHTWEVQQGEDKYFKVMTFSPYARLSAMDGAMIKIMESGIRGNKATKDMAADMTKAINDLLTRGKR